MGKTSQLLDIQLWGKYHVRKWYRLTSIKRCFFWLALWWRNLVMMLGESLLLKVFLNYYAPSQNSKHLGYTIFTCYLPFSLVIHHFNCHQYFKNLWYFREGWSWTFNMNIFPVWKHWMIICQHRTIFGDAAFTAPFWLFFNQVGCWLEDQHVWRYI